MDELSVVEMEKDKILYDTCFFEHLWAPEWSGMELGSMYYKLRKAANSVVCVALPPGCI